MVSANTIDISEFQDPKIFDYQAAKNAGIKTLIIRGSVSMRLDRHAKEHIANAKKYGFNWHLYHYYYGGSGEADYAVQAAQELGLSSNQYLFLDMEDSSLPNDWSASFEIFRKKAQSHFKVGLYCSDSPYKAKFNDPVLRQEHVARWVASYSYEPQNYDIWQMSGAGSGGFGSYNHDVDRDYDKTGLLTTSSSSGGSDKPATPTKPSGPGYRAIILEDGIDTETGVYGRGYSYDNGKSFYVTDTTYGRKYRQEDADRLYPYLKKYIGSGSATGPTTSSIAWADILDKPDLVTESELESKLSQYTPPTTAVSWDSITGKPNIALKSDLPTTMSWSAITDKPDLSQYATQADLDKIKTTPGEQGKPGKDGQPGKDGKSAYQIAVDNGFKGTEAQWLKSLVAQGKDLSEYIWTAKDYYSNTNSQGRLSYVAWSGNKQDLNEMRTPGFYFCWGNDDDGTKNKPDGATSTWGLCFVFDYNGSNHDTYQVYVDLLKYKVYNRDYETKWSDWVQVGGSSKVITETSGDALSSYDDGRYEINYDADDCPSKQKLHGLLTVDKGSTWTRQIFTNTTEDADNNHHIGDTYVRMLVDGNWSDWRQTTAWN